MQGGGGPAEPVPYLVPSDWTTKNLREGALAFSAKGGVPAEVAERHPRLNPCDCTTVDIPSAERHPQCDPCEKLTKEVLVPGDWTTKNPYYCHAELRERAEALSENHAFRGAVFRESSKTVSASVRSRVLPVSLDRSRNKFGMTLVEPVLQFNPTKNAAFTMAEILLSLTIIGVVAAITLPSLTGNINERTWNTQRKALYSRFSQAIALMPSLNGYGTLTEGVDSSGSKVITEDTATETFLSAGLSKVLKLNNICDSEHLEDCGITSKIVALNGDTVSTPTTMKELNQYIVNNNFGEYSGVLRSHSQIDTKAAAFETQNGESILAFYSPACAPNNNEDVMHNSQDKMCVNFVYDLNGTKGPNTFGKDIGALTVFYPVDSIVVAPFPANKDWAVNSTQQNATSVCTQQDSEYRLPNRFELAAIYTNKLFLNNMSDRTHYWSSSVISSTKGWTFGSSAGLYYPSSRDLGGNVRCIKRY